MSPSDCERFPLLSNVAEAKIELESNKKSFHILIVFDFLLSIMLWLIEAQVIGIFKGKVSSGELLDIHQSMLDLVIVSFLRAFFLIIVYVALNFKSRYGVWLTTLVNSLYMIIKVIYFRFSSSLLIDIIVGVAIFILAWVELLYYEAKVFTSLRRVEASEEVSRQVSNSTSDSLHSQHRQAYPIYGSASDYRRGPASVADSLDSFQTPRGSPTSDLAFLCNNQFKDQTVEEEPEQELSEEHRQLVLLGQRTLQTVWQWHNQLPGADWTAEKVTDKVEIYKREADGKRTYRASATLPFSAAQVFRVCFFDNHLMAEWDTTVAESRLLERICDHTRVMYNSCNEMGGGIISARDFVSVLHWDRFDDAWVSSGIVCEHHSMPPQANVVRGENGVCGFVVTPADTSTPSCRFVWYLTTDLKGWLPKSVIDRSLAGVQATFVEKLEQRVLSLASLA